MAHNNLCAGVCSGSIGNFNFGKHKNQNTFVLCHYTSIDRDIIFIEFIILILFPSKKASAQGIKKTTLKVVFSK